jgi:hypothetical protein
LKSSEVFDTVDELVIKYVEDKVCAQGAREQANESVLKLPGIADRSPDTLAFNKGTLYLSALKANKCFEFQYGGNEVECTLLDLYPDIEPFAPLTFADSTGRKIEVITAEQYHEILVTQYGCD